MIRRPRQHDARLAELDLHRQLQAEPRQGGHPLAEPRAVAVRFVLVEVFKNYLTCKPWDGSQAIDVTVNVAKPAGVAAQQYDGRTVGLFTYNYTGAQTREVTKGGETEQQIIVPQYDLPAGGFEGSFIDADPCSITVLDDDGVTAVFCPWLERSARWWARST